MVVLVLLLLAAFSVSAAGITGYVYRAGDDSVTGEPSYWFSTSLWMTDVFDLRWNLHSNPVTSSNPAVLTLDGYTTGDGSYCYKIAFTGKAGKAEILDTVTGETVEAFTVHATAVGLFIDDLFTIITYPFLLLHAVIEACIIQPLILLFAS
jgi:hypothetical protein